MQANQETSLTVSQLTWGHNGSFAFNFWFSQTENQGALFQYLLSARNPDLPPVNDTTVFYPNQVCSHYLSACVSVAERKLRRPRAWQCSAT